MGSAACAALSARGLRVAGVEQFALGHELGSSSGRTRIIRMAYFEDPAYVPLLRRAYEGWQALEERSGESLFARIGLAMIGRPESATIRGVERAAALHGVTLEALDAAQTRARFPALTPLAQEVTLFEPDAGVVFPERAIAAQLALAKDAGADLFADTTVEAIEPRPDAIVIRLHGGPRLRAARAVLTTGAWTRAFADALPLRVERNVQWWFSARTPQCQPPQLPAFFIERAGFAHPLYGIPDLGDGVKVAFHGSGVFCEASHLERSVGADEERQMRGALAQVLPGADGAMLANKACMYTRTPDDHFAVGTHPRDARITLLAGFSGHGFKFAPVMGEIAADLVTGQTPPFDLGFLSPARWNATLPSA